MKKEKINKFMIAAFGSAISGAIVGLLFAPEKGATTRKKISQSGDRYLEKIKNDLEQLRLHLNKQANAAKDGLHEFGENAKDKGKVLYKNTKKLTSYDEWTKEELYDYAKKNGIEKYSKMNKNELIEALRNQ